MSHGRREKVAANVNDNLLRELHQNWKNREQARLRELEKTKNELG